MEQVDWTRTRRTVGAGEPLAKLDDVPGRIGQGDILGQLVQ